MDTDNLIAHGRARFEHAVARRTLEEKYQARMTFAHAGGLWRAGPELMTLLHICKPTVPQVILDLYNTPVRVVPQELFELASERWQEQMNAWLVEYEQSNQTR
jgi:hypothetical protein